MADRADLLALADRVEREEPSPELDAAVLVAFGHQAIDRGKRLGWEWRPNGKGVWARMPAPTTSLDSAVTLVPKGWAPTIVARCDGIGYADVYECGSQVVCKATAKTLAAALVAAALRARAGDSGG